METVTVKLGDCELEVSEQFIKAYGEVKDFISVWNDTFDQLTDLLIYFGSLENGTDVDYKNFIILMGSIRDIRRQLNELAAAKVLVKGNEIKGN